MSGETTITIALFALPPAVALAVVGYRHALTRSPEVRCRPCRGTGYRLSRVFAHSDARCPTCAGNGRRPRTGTRLLNVR
ncbi:hypothetical protein [Sphaerisporangium corydalis]|uniref:Prepilin peptidase n=1 Tax=Sphaerisporangium corydalis TaxID=1441875 RepID=A0ABV9EK11_9ACTN|nr:hypothetical protein [Sphaerisporangium corydalis]